MSHPEVAPAAETLDTVPTAAEAPARRRKSIAGGLVLVAVIGYISLFVLTAGFLEFRELTFTSAAGQRARPLDVYIDVLGVDPVRETMHLRIHVADGGGSHGKHYFGSAARDLSLRLSDGGTEQDVMIRRGAPLPSTLFDADLQGSIRTYPFDRFALRLLVSATGGAAGGGAIPLQLTLWDGEPAWNMTVVRSIAEATPAVGLTFELRRRTPLVFFACAVYAIMVLIAAGAIAISTRVWTDRTRAESTLIGALTAMVFALPAVRNTLPGSPPLGVAADVFIFLWAELAIATSLALLVFAWIRKGAAPR